MLMYSLNARVALAIRAFGLFLIGWTVLASKPAPAASGRGLVVAVLLAIGVVAWVIWSWQSYARRTVSGDLFVLAGAGGLLVAAAPSAAGSAFAFVAIATAGFRLDFPRAVAVTALGVFTVALGVLIYDQAAIEVLAYGLGFVAVLLAGANARQTVGRADQAELLLAQVQRSREEQLRAARLEESARIAREIHDVLAHSLAGLAIQLEATSSLVQGGAERSVVLERLRRAHALAREGLEETRRAVGVLRSEGLAVAEALEALLADYRSSSSPVAASLQLGDVSSRLEGPVALAVVRVAQEALTNVRKHAPGASVRVELELDAGAPGTMVSSDTVVPSDTVASDTDTVVLRICNGPPPGGGSAAAESLAASGGGYGLRGMRERAEILGGSLLAGPDGDGWRVELRLPHALAGQATDIVPHALAGQAPEPVPAAES
jgi:signal transduction histidine kinase